MINRIDHLHRDQLEILHQEAINLLANMARRPDVHGLRYAQAGTLGDYTNGLEEAQNCIAVENGYADWATMLDAVLQPPSEDDKAKVWLAEKTLNGQLDSDLLSKPRVQQLIHENLGIRIAMLDSSLSLEKEIGKDPDRLLEPLDVPALVYLCCSRYGNEISELRLRRRKWVDWLLQEGANANAGRKEMDSIRGYQTCLGGAIGRAKDKEVVPRLLQHGADVADGPTLYEGCAMWEAVRHQDHVSLQNLLDAGPPEWHVCHALTHCLQNKDQQMMSMLLDHGGDPNWDKTVFGMGGNALHEAIHCDCPVEMLETLLKHGANIEAKDHAGRTPLVVATGFGYDAVCDYLVAKGANSNAVGNTEKWVGSCFKGEFGESDELRERYIDPYELSYHDDLWVHEAIERKNSTASSFLLEGVLTPEAFNYRGESAMHVAVRMADYYAIDELMMRGASATELNYDGETPIELAMRLPGKAYDEILESFVERLEEVALFKKGARLKPGDIDDFEAAADAVVYGDLDTLKEKFEQFPYFARARSPRPHRCTLMHYIGVNGFEGERQRSPSNAVEVIEFLLSKGCDPNATCYTYRGGQGETTLGLLLSSGVVESEEQKLAMVRALVKGGADIEPAYKQAFMLMDSRIEGNLERIVSYLVPTEEMNFLAFQLLVNFEEYEVVSVLLKAGFDINASNELNQTALHWAAFNGKRELVLWLLERGADPMLEEDQFNGNAEGWALAGGNPAIAALIKEFVVKD